MPVPLLTAALPLIGKAVDHFFPDATEEERIKLEAMKTAIALDIAQQEVNKAEAEHSSVFVAGWRPFVGWCAGAGLAYSFIGQPLLSWASLSFGVPVPPPMDLTQLITVLVTMLGMGSLRTFEGLQGIKRNSIKSLVE